MKTLIYSFLAPDPDHSAIDYNITDLVDMWYRHLRGPGQYSGDIMLFSNSDTLTRPGLHVVPLSGIADAGQHVFYTRVFNHPNVPAQDYDVILQTDLDILAVNDVTPLFMLDTPFCAAASGLKLYDNRHVGNARHFPFDFWKKWIPGQQKRQAVSACVFACQGSQWTRCMSAWSQLIRRHQHKHLAFKDQTILNLAYARGAFPIRSYPPHYILHRDWDIKPEPILLHFPTSNRLDIMRKHCLV